MVEAVFNTLFNLMHRFFEFLSGFILWGGISYLSFVVFLAVLWLIVRNFIPRG